MARKKRKKAKTNDLISLEATVRKLQAELVDPRVQTWLWRGARGVRERIHSMSFNLLRQMSSQLPLVGGIINTRTDQVRPYSRFAVEDGAKGFKFALADKTQNTKKINPDDDEVIQLARFIEQTGFLYDPDREDDFADFVGMFVRDTYEIDQIATEIQRNRRGEVTAFWAVDGATVKRVTLENENGLQKDVRFVQTLPDMENEIVAQFTHEDLIFDYMYKRSDIRYRGYGFSPIEQCVNIITTLLFGYNYLRDQLVRDRMPKGFISVMGDVGKEQMDSIRNYWYAAMTGAGAQWNMPILPSGKEGVGMDFKLIGSSNKDMEYHKTMMFVTSMVAAVFSIDMAELGIKTDDSTSLVGENAEPRIQSSKDRGLASMLSFLEQHINKVLRKVTQKYHFTFVGMEQEDKSRTADIRNKQIQGWRTIDEIRQADDLPPFNTDWSQMPLSAQTVQMETAAQQNAMMEPPDDMLGPPDMEGNMQKSMADFRKATKRADRRIWIPID